MDNIDASSAGSIPSSLMDHSVPIPPSPSRTVPPSFDQPIIEKFEHEYDEQHPKSHQNEDQQKKEEAQPPQDDTPNIEMMVKKLNVQACHCLNTDDYDGAELALNEALTILQNITQTGTIDPATLCVLTATTLNNTGIKELRMAALVDNQHITPPSSRPSSSKPQTKSHTIPSSSPPPSSSSSSSSSKDITTALAYFRQAAATEMKARSLRADSVSITASAQTVLNIGVVLSKLERHADSARYAQRAIGTLIGINTANTTEQMKNNFNKLDIRSKILLCIALYNLGAEYEYLSSYKEARNIYKQGIALAKTLGKASLSLLTNFEDAYDQVNSILYATPEQLELARATLAIPTTMDFEEVRLHALDPYTVDPLTVADETKHQVIDKSQFIENLIIKAETTVLQGNHENLLTDSINPNEDKRDNSVRTGRQSPLRTMMLEAQREMVPTSQVLSSEPINLSRPSSPKKPQTPNTNQRDRTPTRPISSSSFRSIRGFSLDNEIQHPDDALRPAIISSPRGHVIPSSPRNLPIYLQQKQKSLSPNKRVSSATKKTNNNKRDPSQNNDDITPRGLQPISNNPFAPPTGMIFPHDDAKPPIPKDKRFNKVNVKSALALKAEAEQMMDMLLSIDDKKQKQKSTNFGFSSHRPSTALAMLNSAKKIKQRSEAMSRPTTSQSSTAKFLAYPPSRPRSAWGPNDNVHASHPSSSTQKHNDSYSTNNPDYYPTNTSHTFSQPAPPLDSLPYPPSQALSLGPVPSFSIDGGTTGSISSHPTLSQPQFDIHNQPNNNTNSMATLSQPSIRSSELFQPRDAPLPQLNNFETQSNHTKSVQSSITSQHHQQSQQQQLQQQLEFNINDFYTRPFETVIPLDNTTTAYNRRSPGEQTEDSISRPPSASQYRNQRNYTPVSFTEKSYGNNYTNTSANDNNHYQQYETSAKPTIEVDHHGYKAHIKHPAPANITPSPYLANPPVLKVINSRHATHHPTEYSLPSNTQRATYRNGTIILPPRLSISPDRKAWNPSTAIISPRSLRTEQTMLSLRYNPIEPPLETRRKLRSREASRGRSEDTNGKRPHSHHGVIIHSENDISPERFSRPASRGDGRAAGLGYTQPGAETINLGKDIMSPIPLSKPLFSPDNKPKVSHPKDKSPSSRPVSASKSSHETTNNRTKTRPSSAANSITPRSNKATTPKAAVTYITPRLHSNRGPSPWTASVSSLNSILERTVARFDAMAAKEMQNQSSSIATSSNEISTKTSPPPRVSSNTNVISPPKQIVNTHPNLHPVPNQIGSLTSSVSSIPSVSSSVSTPEQLQERLQQRISEAFSKVSANVLRSLTPPQNNTNNQYDSKNDIFSERSINGRISSHNSSFSSPLRPVEKSNMHQSTTSSPSKSASLTSSSLPSPIPSITSKPKEETVAMNGAVMFDLVVSEPHPEAKSQEFQQVSQPVNSHGHQDIVTYEFQSSYALPSELESNPPPPNYNQNPIPTSIADGDDVPLSVTNPLLPPNHHDDMNNHHQNNQDKESYNDNDDDHYNEQYESDLMTNDNSITNTREVDVDDYSKLEDEGEENDMLIDQQHSHNDSNYHMESNRQSMENSFILPVEQQQHHHQEQQHHHQEQHHHHQEQQHHHQEQHHQQKQQVEEIASHKLTASVESVPKSHSSIVHVEAKQEMVNNIDTTGNHSKIEHKSMEHTSIPIFHHVHTGNMLNSNNSMHSSTITDTSTHDSHTVPPHHSESQVLHISAPKVNTNSHNSSVIIEANMNNNHVPETSSVHNKSSILNNDIVQNDENTPIITPSIKDKSIIMDQSIHGDNTTPSLTTSEFPSIHDTPIPTTNEIITGHESIIVPDHDYYNNKHDISNQHTSELVANTTAIISDSNMNALVSPDPISTHHSVSSLHQNVEVFEHNHSKETSPIVDNGKDTESLNASTIPSIEIEAGAPEQNNPEHEETEDLEFDY